MKKQEKVFREVRKVTQELIRCGLAEEYNFPIMQKVEVVWEKYNDISCYLKNMEYAAIYGEIEKNHNFNIKLPDGGIFVKFIMEHFYHEPNSQLEFNFELESVVKFDEHIAESDTKKSRIVI